MAIRSGAQIMALADLFDVSVAVVTELSAGEAEARIPPEVGSACASLSIVSIKSNIMRLLSIARSPRDRMLIQAVWPLALGHARTRPGLRPLADAIAEAHPRRRFDVLHCCWMATASIAGLLRRRGLSWSRSVIDVVDYESFAKSRYVRDFRSAIGRQYAAASWLEAAKLRALETRYIPRFDDAYVCALADQAMLRRRFPGVRWFVVPNVVPEPPPVIRIRNDTFTFLFVGTLDFGANGDGLQFFVREVLPILRTTVPSSFRVIVAGRRPGPAIRALCEFDGIELVADPPVLAPYYAGADAALVPIRYGGGTRIKLLEALSFGVPVVSTEMGAEGLELVGEQDILFANEAPTFAAACARLMSDPALRERLSNRGRNLFKERFGPRSLRDTIRHLHQSFADLGTPEGH